MLFRKKLFFSVFYILASVSFTSVQAQESLVHDGDPVEARLTRDPLD